MQTSEGIFWLASYPKSGNTWFRIVLANVLNQSDDAVSLNQINTGITASSRGLMDTVLGFDCSILSHQELDVLRPSIYQWYGQQAHQCYYFKTHDAYRYVCDEVPLIPKQGTLGALYFVRNPLDVAISLAHHFNCSIDQSIQIMGDKTFTLFETKAKVCPQLRQLFLSWSLHVQSWSSATELNVLLLRYEDMSFAPLATFQKALKFLNIEVSDEHLLKALEHAQIEKLQQQEQQFGFEERSFVQQGPFFRKGIVGDWEYTLSERQIQQIIHDHSERMRQLGYLDENDHPIRYREQEVCGS